MLNPCYRCQIHGEGDVPILSKIWREQIKPGMQLATNAMGSIQPLYVNLKIQNTTHVGTRATFPRHVEVDKTLQKQLQAAKAKIHKLQQWRSKQKWTMTQVISRTIYFQLGVKLEHQYKLT